MRAAGGFVWLGSTHLHICLFGSKHFRSTQEDGHVSVVTTCMHDAIILRFEFQVSSLLQRQGVHVCPQREAWMLAGSTNHANDTSTSDTGMNFINTVALELFRNPCSGLRLVV